MHKMCAVSKMLSGYYLQKSTRLYGICGNIKELINQSFKETLFISKSIIHTICK